jgi:hypothetical protein
MQQPLQTAADLSEPKPRAWVRTQDRVKIKGVAVKMS